MTPRGKKLLFGYVGSCASAPLFLAAFPNRDAWPLAFVAFVPMWLSAVLLPRRHARAASYLAGVVFFACATWWIAYATVVGYVAAALFLGLFWTALAEGVRRLLGSAPKAAAFTVPALGVALEKIRSHIFGGFPWFFAAHPLYGRTRLIQAADVVGTLGISFFVYLVNFALFATVFSVFATGTESVFADYRAWLRSRADRWRGSTRVGAVIAAVFAAAVASALTAYGEYRLKNLREEDALKILAVQGNIPQRLKEMTMMNQEEQKEAFWKMVRKHKRLTLEGLKAPDARDVDLVVWPETAVTYQPSVFHDVRKFMEGVVRETGRPLLFGAVHAWFNADKKLVLNNSAYLMSSRGEVVDRYDKIHLVLFSEYMPLKNTLRFLKALVPENFGTLTPGFRNTVFKVGGRRFGVAICYEDTISKRFREIKRSGCDFALNITNDAWFRSSEELEQHLAISVFLAVENRIGLFRNGNTGISASISPTGRIESAAPRDKACTYTGRVRTTKATPLYTRYGDVFAWCAIFACTFGLFRAAFRAEKRW